MERPHEARAAGDAGQALHLGAMADLDSQHPWVALLHDVQAQPLAPGTHRVLGHLVQVLGNASQERGPHLGPVGLAMQRAIGHQRHAGPCRPCRRHRLLQARSTRVVGKGSFGRPRPPRGPARARCRPWAPGRGPGARTSPRWRRPGRKGPGSRRSPPAAGARSDPGGRSAARPAWGSTANRRGRCAGRTRSCVPRHRPRWTAAARAPRAGGTGPPRCPAVPGSCPRGRLPCAAARAARAPSEVLSSVSRCATNTSVLSPASFQARDCAASQATRGSASAAIPARRRSLTSASSSLARRGRSAHPEASARCRRSAFLRRATGSSAGTLRTVSTSASCAPQPTGSSISTGAGSRGGRPPMSLRRVEDVQGGSGSPPLRRCSNEPSSGSSSGRRSWTRRRNPCASSSKGVAVRSST